MSFTVRLLTVIVGRTELERADPATRVASGQFRPGLGYELIQPIFRLWAEAVPIGSSNPPDAAKLERYRRARDQLGLSLVDETGRVLETSAIHIIDYSIETGRREYEIELCVSDSAFWASRSPE